MYVEIGAEAALFPEKEYISGVFLAVCIYKYFYILNTYYFELFHEHFTLPL
jgi:hypothetical protein